MSVYPPRAKYLDQLEAQLRRMAEQLDRKRTWLNINNGDTGATMVGIDAAAAQLVRAAAAMDKEIHGRRHRKVAPFPAKAAR